MPREIIVYETQCKPGGMDGLSGDKGGEHYESFLTRTEAEVDPNAPWRNINAVVINEYVTASEALKKLTPTERLILGLPATPRTVADYLRKLR